MIVFRVFGISPDPFGKEYDEDKIIKPFTDLNDDSFKFYTSSLELQSSKEWNSEWFKSTLTREGTNLTSQAVTPDQSTINHFTHRNHIILSNIITNHFKKTDLTEVWHERFIRDFKKIERNNNQLVDYIYN
jgi:lambda repressor-like predicted transcriptional regulator